MRELMTKERLSQYRALQEEIKLLKDEIKELEAAAEGGVGHYGKEPRYKREPRMFKATDRVGGYGTRIVHIKDKMEDRLKESIAELEVLTDFINGIEDALIRVVFTQRYVYGMAWQQVAVKLGGNTADSVRMMHNRFLQRLEKEGKIA